MIPHYSFLVPDGQPPSLSFTEGGRTCYREFAECTRGNPGCVLEMIAPGNSSRPPPGEIFHYTEVPVSILKGRPYEERIEKVAHLAEEGFQKIVADFTAHMAALTSRFREEFGEEPAATFALWRTTPTILCADDLKGGPAGPTVGFSTFCNLAMVVSGARLPDECLSCTPVPFPSYSRPGIITDEDTGSRKGRALFAQGALSGLDLQVLRIP